MCMLKLHNHLFTLSWWRWWRWYDPDTMEWTVALCAGLPSRARWVTPGNIWKGMLSTSEPFIVPLCALGTFPMVGCILSKCVHVCARFPSRCTCQHVDAWRKVKQMQPVWSCTRDGQWPCATFSDAHICILAHICDICAYLLLAHFSALKYKTCNAWLSGLWWHLFHRCTSRSATVSVFQPVHHDYCPNLCRPSHHHHCRCHHHDHLDDREAHLMTFRFRGQKVAWGDLAFLSTIA